MRRPIHIIVILNVLALMVACHSKVEVEIRTEKTSPELSAIDSLMWHRPDSALLVLMAYEGDTGAFNSHYTQLLASELLYKNDYAQTNRTELLQAVAYFDSLLVLADTRYASKKNAQNGTIAFLDARAHYINGAGYYEQDSLVPACAEYLKTLEVMEEHFEGKDLVGHQARFMALTYSHLGKLFKEEILIEPSIECFKKALYFCKLEPTSKYGISVSLYNLGILFNIIERKDSADFYYIKAIENLPDKDNLHYRDIITTKTILDYYSGQNLDSVIKNLNLVISLAADENERLTRFLTIGNIFYENKMYDSARWFLESVFEQQSDVQARMLAAEELRSMYQEKGDYTKANQYATFLANLTIPEYEKKTDVSKLNELFQNYLIQKQEQKTVQEKKEAVLRTVRILVPIALVVAIVIVAVIRKKNKKNLAKQKAEAQRDMEKKVKQHKEALEAEVQTHRMQQAALSGRLKRSNEELRDISNQLEQMLAKNVSSEAALSNDYEAFVNTPVCLYIVGLVHKQQFKSKMDYLIYKDDALNKEQLLALRNAAEQHLALFVSHLRNQFPGLTDNDMDYCYLILLGLNEADISALLQKAYTTVCDRSRKINRIIGATGSLYHTLHHMLS